jgi:lysophospholipase L1-like esterase
MLFQIRIAGIFRAEGAMRRLKLMAAVLALLGVSVAFASAVAEIGLRLFPELMPEDAQLRRHWRDLNQPVTLADPYVGYMYPPNHVGRISRSDDDFAFTFTTDEHGFRNPSPWPERADIIVLGDSMAFGYGVDDDEAWTAVLAEQLPSHRIINLGLMGAAPQQYFRIYERFGQALQPDLILFCLFPGNDVGDAGRFDEWLKAGADSDYRKWRHDENTEHTSVARRLRGLLTQSYVVNLLRDARKKAFAQVSGRTVDFADGSRLQLAPAVYAGNESLIQPGHPNFRLVLDIAQRTRALAEQNGSHLLVLLIPTKEEVYLPLIEESPPPGIAPFVAAFEEAGIPYLDLTPPLQARARQGERLFFEVDGHPNAAGYRLMADVVLDYLRSNPGRYDLARPHPANTPTN